MWRKASSEDAEGPIYMHNYTNKHEVSGALFWYSTVSDTYLINLKAVFAAQSWHSSITILEEEIHIPCTFRTAGSLNCVDRTGSRMISSHTTKVLLNSSLAGMCKERLFPCCWAVISLLRSANTDPLTSQAIEIPVALVLQLKVAVDPSVALTDVGMLIKPG